MHSWFEIYHKRWTLLQLTFEFEVTENLAHSQITTGFQHIYPITIHVALLATSGVLRHYSADPVLQQYFTL